MIGRNKVIMRWLAHRGGALDFATGDRPDPASRTHRGGAGRRSGDHSGGGDAGAGYLVGIRVCWPAARLAHRAGAMSGQRIAGPGQRRVGAGGTYCPDETALEGPFGDHTGYYNEVDRFPVFTIERITHREQPIYHSTYTGRPPDEPAILGVALNEVFVPILQKQFPKSSISTCRRRVVPTGWRWWRCEKQYPGMPSG